METAIDLGPFRLPGAEDGADRAPELVVHILREGLFPQFLDQFLVSADQSLEVVGIKVGVEMDALVLLGDLKRFLEGAVIEAEHDIGIHLDEAAVAVPGEARIARRGGEPFHRLVVKAEVQHRVHHARHGDAGAGAHRNEQRIGLVAEALAGNCFDMADAVGDLLAQAVGEALSFRIIAGAHFRGDGETRWHRQTDRGHFGEVRALAAQEVLVARFTLRDAAAEAVDVARHGRPSPRKVPMFAVAMDFSRNMLILRSSRSQLPHAPPRACGRGG